MNGDHHRDLTECALHMARVPREQWAALVDGAKGADYIDDVTCPVPFRDAFPGTWSALCHFEPGYRWNRDTSLGALEEIGDAALHMAGSIVSGTSQPMRDACLAQPGAVLSDFVFPSASVMGSHWSTFPAFSAESGRAMHMVQDACCPHHVWGALLWGHQDFEDQLETEWNKHRALLKQVGADAEFTGAVRAELAGISNMTVGQLILANASWAREWFGMPHRMDECPWDSMLAICVRAVASTMRAIELMR